MHVWLLLVPLVAALSGWLIHRLLIKMFFYPLYPVQFMGFTFHGMLYRRKGELALAAAKAVSRELALLEGLGQKIASEENLQKIMPDVEGHIDHFLRVKLKDAMPMVAMFVGDRTITQMKEVFMAELRELFPDIMKKYIGVLQHERGLEQMIAGQLAGLPPEKIQLLVQPVIYRETRWIEIMGALTGFITGLILLLLNFFMVR